MRRNKPASQLPQVETTTPMPPVKSPKKRDTPRKDVEWYAKHQDEDVQKTIAQEVDRDYSTQKPKMNINPMAVATAGVKPNSNPSSPLDFSLQQTFSLPSVPKGVIPENSKLAMDSAFTPFQEFGYDSIFAEGLGFLGYSYLAQLSQRAEYRKPAEIIAEYMTKNWLEFKGVGDDDKTEKIKQLEDEFKRLHVKDAFAKAAELDCYYGRSQIFIDTGNQDSAELQMKLPAVPAKIRKNGIKKLKVVEPYWTYPNDYNSTNPLADDFFHPNSWFVMGQQIHTTRFLNFVARPVSDILKPVYNFGGLSLTQILKPYVDNWLRTRQSVSDLLYSFSINVLKTNMGSILSGGGGEDVGLRVDVFNKYRDNRGCFVLDKDTEDFINVSAPLGTIDKLQAQSQEQMASVAGIPLIILLKITPSGLNASSEGEIRTFNDWIESQQVSLFGPQMDRLLPMVQLSLWGEIDPDITYKWVPLNPKDEIADANRRKVEADTDAVYIEQGVIDTTEARTRLAKQEDSPYAGLDLSVVPEPPQASEEEVGGLEELLSPEKQNIPGMDAEFREEDHPRQDDGKFGSGSGGSKQPLKRSAYSELADAEDLKGKLGVYEKALEMIKENPDRFDEINEAISDLGWQKLSKQEKVDNKENIKPSKKEEIESNEQNHNEVSGEFGEPEWISPKRIEPPHEVRDKEKLADLVSKLKKDGWQGRPILAVDLGQGPEALTGSHRIAAARIAKIEVPVIMIDSEIGNYQDSDERDIRDLMKESADEMANWLEQAGYENESNLMMAEHEA